MLYSIGQGTPRFSSQPSAFLAWASCLLIVFNSTSWCLGQMWAEQRGEGLREGTLNTSLLCALLAFPGTAPRHWQWGME